MCRIEPQDPYKALYIGVYEEYVVIAGRKRRYLVYIPNGVRPSTAAVFILPANGKTAEDTYRDSWWRMIADTEETKEKMILFFLEPQDRKWNTEEEYGRTDGDVAYIKEVYEAASRRLKYCIHESKFYLTGCREGGMIAHMTAMYHPTAWAGIVSVGGSAIPEKYKSAASLDFCTNLHGFQDMNHRKNIRKSQVAVPVWIIEDPNCEMGMDNGTVYYWIRSNGITEEGRLINENTTKYQRTADTEYGVNQDKEAFVVWKSVIKYSSADFANLLLRCIWKKFLYRHRRWMSGPGGDLRITKDPVEDIGMEYHFEEIDGWMREWYVYVPDSVKNSSGKSAPLVFALHGYSCTGEVYIGNSGWHQVADQYGFIVVYPTALPGKVSVRSQATDPANMVLPSWNYMNDFSDRPDENQFFKVLLEKVGAQYSVDVSRIYLTGHSNGSMMVQELAMAETSIFAACAACSGIIFRNMGEYIMELPEIKNRMDLEIPMWMFGGEKEEWLLPHIPEESNDTGNSIRIWQKINHIEEEYMDYWIVKGRWHDLIYENREHIPLVRYTWVEYMPHATMPEMSFRIWEDFFSRFSRKNGKIMLV